MDPFSLAAVGLACVGLVDFGRAAYCTRRAPRPGPVGPEAAGAATPATQQARTTRGPQAREATGDSTLPGAPVAHWNPAAVRPRHFVTAICELENQVRQAQAETAREKVAAAQERHVRLELQARLDALLQRSAPPALEQLYSVRGPGGGLDSVHGDVWLASGRAEQIAGRIEGHQRSVFVHVYGGSGGTLHVGTTPAQPRPS